MKPLVNCCMEDKQDIIKAVFLHLTIFWCLGEWEQLGDGLNILGVCKEMAANRHSFEGFFTTKNKEPLTAGMNIILISYILLTVSHCDFWKLTDFLHTLQANCYKHWM